MVFESYSYENDNATTKATSLCSTRDAIAIQIVSGSPLIGNTIASFTCKLAINGSPTGSNVECRVYSPNGDEGTLREISSTVLSIGSIVDGTDHTFTFDGTYTLAVNDVICVMVLNTSGSDCATDYLSWYYNSADDDSANFQQCEYDGNEWSNKRDDSSYVRVTGGSTPPPEGGTLLPPPYANIGLHGL